VRARYKEQARDTENVRAPKREIGRGKRGKKGEDGDDGERESETAHEQARDCTSVRSES